MAERIPDDVALNLSRLFYRNLKQLYPIDLSLSRARQGLLSSYGSNQLYWALPILYLHPEFDGYLQSSDEVTEPAAVGLPDDRAVDALNWQIGSPVPGRFR
ncbi:CHAT domain-containing protein [Kovacikia minuta CCNUW1]|uniref:CHAT domain-containing protein n=1 Tax=Kovacikia minuta TaxID=2931930 RepID=UPI001CCC9EFA|nr:CHAT domain-containing protein [Kovacikia minuta CCNUW1]